jgi:ribosomal protein L37AE/L43A
MNKITLPSLHKKKINEIEEHEKTLPQLHIKLQELASNSSFSLEVIDLQETIVKYENERMDYLLNTSEAMFRYFEDEKTRTNKKHLKGIQDLIKPTLPKCNIQISDRMDYYNKYRAVVDSTYVHINESAINDDNYCTICNKFRLLNPDNGMLICDDCGSQVTASGMNDKPTTKDHQQSESRYYEYKRFLIIYKAKKAEGCHQKYVMRLWLKLGAKGWRIGWKSY